MTRTALLMTAWGLLLGSGGALGQSIRGVVVEEGTATGIPGVRLELFAKAGARVALGYAPVDGLELRVAPREAVDVQLRLGRVAIPLEPLLVTARGATRHGGFHDRMRQGTFGQFLTREEIGGRAGARNATDLLRGRAGVEIVSVGRGGSDRDPPPPLGAGNELLPRVNLITMRSGNFTCEPAIYVDGRRVRQYRDTGIDDLIKPDMIEGVEYYPRSAGAPIEFGDSDSCGVVAFWTRLGEGGGGWSWERLGAGLSSGLAAFVLLVMLTR